MEIYISYFYHIRHFTPNMIPVSTAIYDPKWYHDNKGQNYFFKDKNGVYNGIRSSYLFPGQECDGLCKGKEGDICVTGEGLADPNKCEFLTTYRNMLERIGFDKIYFELEGIANVVEQRDNVSDPIIVLMVYETPDNPCSERSVIVDFFKENGVEVRELVFD